MELKGEAGSLKTRDTFPPLLWWEKKKSLEGKGDVSSVRCLPDTTLHSDEPQWSSARRPARD